MKCALFLIISSCLAVAPVMGQDPIKAEPRQYNGPVLGYSTYLGGSGGDDCDALAVDGSGNVYLACHSTSTDFPTADSAHYANRGKFDAFVVKLNPSGSEVIYVAHFGGSKWEAGNGITVDAAGNAYVVGSTYSPDFPTTDGAFQTTFGGQQDVFVTKLDSSGSVVYATYLGGGGEDLSYGIAIDDFGNVYVAGMTESPDFPTANPFQPALGGGRDAFVAKLTPSGTALVYSTYLGGSGNEGRWGARIAVDATGNAYVAGGTESADFPTVNPLQAALAGKQDTFVAKLNPTGSALVYSTYLGGSGEEEDSDLAIDASGNVYVAGGTDSTNFPTTNAVQKVLGGGQDAFVAKLNPTGSALIYSTYLGGKGNDSANSIAVDAAGRASVTGGSDSTNFPTAKPVQGAFAGGKFDAFVTKFNSAGSALVYSTYLGGSGRDLYERIALDPAGNAYVAGLTNSPDLPTTNAIQAAYGGGVFDVMVAKFSEKSAVIARRVAEVDTTGGVSPDGRFLTYTDWRTGDLAVRVLKTEENRRLTNKGSWLESSEFALFSTTSPDSTQVAYGWFNKEGFWELRIIGADGSNPRTLYRDKETYPWPMNWSPDGKHILATFQGKDRTWQIVLVSVADGSTQVVKDLDWRSPLKVSYSPDGQFIAYDLLAHEDSPGRDIFLLPLDTGDEIPLVQHPANDLLLGWAPYGSGVLFASDRRGSLDAWVIQVADGKPQQTPELVQQDLGPNVVALGFDRKGTYYYGISADLADLYVATLDPTTGKLQPSPEKLSPAANNSSPAWSPDGQQLAYLQRRGAGAWDLYTSVLLIRSIRSAQERRLPLRMRSFHDFRLQWLPDENALLAQGRDHTGRQGFYRIDAETGQVTPVVQSDTGCPNNCLEWPAWPPSRKLVFTRWTNDRQGTAGQSIVVRDLETGGEMELFSVLKPSFVGPLTVSPDGRWLAYVWRDLEKGTSVLTVMPAAGGAPRELLRRQPPEGIGDLGWMPDSHRIVYATRTSGEERKFELWRISAEGGEPQSLGMTMEGLVSYGLSVHPDGRRIAFTAGRPRRNEVWVLENFLPEVKAVR